MKSYVCLLIVLVFCEKSYTLKCYDCEAETLYACRKGSPFVKNASCGLEHPNFFRFCITRVRYDKILKKTEVKMGCDLLGKPANFKTIPQCTLDKELYELRDCRICTTDFCSFLSSGQDLHQLRSIHFVLLCFCITIVLAFDVLFTYIIK